MKKNILYCENNADGTIGGSFYSLLFLAESVDRGEFSPSVVFYQQHPLIPQFEAAGIRSFVMSKPAPFHLPWLAQLRRSRTGRLLAVPLLGLQKGINLLRGLGLPALQCMQFLRRHRIDLVHLNNSVIRNHPWMLAALLTGTPCVTHERGINQSYSWLSRTLAKRLKAVICISYSVRDYLVRGGIDPANLVVIRNGIDPDRLKVSTPAEEIRREFGLDEAQPVIGVVGNIKEWKGQETAVRAVALLKAQFPNLACLLVGDTAPADAYYEDRLRALVAEHGLERNIIFCGYRKNVPDFVNAMSIVLHTSIDPEPFGRVLIEAMALRRPVIGARAGAVPEILDEDTAGLTFAPGSADELAARIDELLRAPDRARAMGERGYQRVNEEFHISGNTARTESLYRSLLSGSIATGERQPVT